MLQEFITKQINEINKAQDDFIRTVFGLVGVDADKYLADPSYRAEKEAEGLQCRLEHKPYEDSIIVTKDNVTYISTFKTKFDLEHNRATITQNNRIERND